METGSQVPWSLTRRGATAWLVSSVAWVVIWLLQGLRDGWNWMNVTGAALGAGTAIMNSMTLLRLKAKGTRDH